MLRFLNVFALSSSLALLSLNCSPVLQPIVKQLKKSKNDEVVLRVYNCEDYIDENLITEFEDYCLDTSNEYNETKNVKVVYSCYDTNETMLSQLDLGIKFDLICASDYVVEKLVKKDMLVPFDDNITVHYKQDVSSWVDQKIKSLGISDYIRGYMWGTLGILYNDSYSGLESRNITPKQINNDMLLWSNLWNDKYKNLIALKDSMRDMYAVGMFSNIENDKNFDYNSLQDEFNKCDDKTLKQIEKQLITLKNNSFGFEVDSGKIDMAQGNKFAIDIAWSGDAAYAMDLADEGVEDEEGNIIKEGYSNLRYTLPSAGANIWFDGWFMPKGSSDENQKWAQRFVDFLSRSDNAAKNMDYIGYTPVIAGHNSDSSGSEILDLVKSYYDVRYDEETEQLDQSVLDELEKVDYDDLSNISFNEDGSLNETLDEKYYEKDVSYFFNDFESEDTKFCVSASEYKRGFDSQYPNKELLNKLAIMQDFGNQNLKLVEMWQNVKNTPLPIWAYILILVVVLACIGGFIYYKVRKNKIKKDRIARRALNTGEVS